MSETNKRSLPTWPSMKLAAIEICLNKPGMEDTVAETAQEKQEANNKELKRRHAQCGLSIFRAKTQLEKMQQQYQTCLNMLHVAKWMPTVLPTILPISEQKPHDLEWTELYARVASSKMDTCSIAKQQLLQIKIDILQYELDKIGELIGVV
jgi:hypothetical protein